MGLPFTKTISTHNMEVWGPAIVAQIATSRAAALVHF